MGIDFSVESLDEAEFGEGLEKASDYQDQTDAPPPDAGNYTFRIDEAKLKADQDGKLVLDNGFAQVQVNKITILEPESHANLVLYPFQAFSFKPRESGKRIGSRAAVDLLRGLDDQATFANGQEALGKIQEAAGQGNTISAILDWVGKDSEAIKAFIDENGGDLSDVSPEDRQAFFNKAITRGQKNFPKGADGKRVPVLTGMSGEEVTAKVNIGRIYPSSKGPKKLGAFKLK